MTYKTRLLIYVGTLVVLIIGMMTLSFRMARNVILVDAEEHLRHAAHVKQDRIRVQREELARFTELISGDLRLQEALYVVLELGAGKEGVVAYYKRQFGALPVDCRLILSTRGDVLLGEEYPLLIEEVRARMDAAQRGHFYFRSPDGVVMAAMAPVVYQGQRLATVVVARTMNQDWLIRQEHRKSSDYVLFFEDAGQVLWSSNPDYNGLTVDIEHGALQGGRQHFSLHQVELGDNGSEVPRLWLGISETSLLALLKRYERWTLWLAVAGGMVVLLFGWLMLRNFNKPFTQLMQITGQMMNGRLPTMTRSQSNTEMDRLVNRFADVLDALRREQEEVRRVHKKLQETAIRDSLTGLYNRRYLQEMTPALLAQVVRDGRYLTAILLDLDYFKRINDQYGHLAGDAVLVHFSTLLRQNSRTSDHVFRLGGEEFLILNLADRPQGSVVLANKLRELVNRLPVHYQGYDIPVSVSAGVSCCFGDQGEGSLSRLLSEADKALYQAKSAGRNRVVVHASCRVASDTVKQHRLTLVSTKPDPGA